MSGSTTRTMPNNEQTQQRDGLKLRQEAKVSNLEGRHTGKLIGKLS